jgi:hypothetical protein
LDSKEYFNHISVVLECLLALNFISPLGATERKSLWEHLRTRAWQSLKSIDPNIYKRDVHQVLGLDIASFFDIARLSVRHDHKRPELEYASGSTFGFDDFNLDSLHDIGKLSIRWTAFLERHVELEIAESTL